MPPPVPDSVVGTHWCDLDWRPYEDVIRHIENGGLPLDRPMITPVEITRDPRLTTILRQGL